MTDSDPSPQDIGPVYFPRNMKSVSDPSLDCCGAHPVDANAVPIAELEALADELEQRKDRIPGHGTAEGAAYHHCIKQLRELIQDYQ